MNAPIFIATAVVGLCLAGCGSAPKVPPAGAPGDALTFTAPTTTTFASPRTGQRMVCDNHGVRPSAYVPSPGHGVSGAADGKNASAIITLTRHNDGTLVVSCTP
jgi:hypothetical protein